MQVPHIEIKNIGIFTEVFVDGKKINGVRKVKFEHGVPNAPVLQLELIATDMAIDTKNIPELPDVFKPFYEKKH